MIPFWTDEKLIDLYELKGSHTNEELAGIFKTTRRHIIYSMNYFGIKRTKEEIEYVMHKASQVGANNHNWKGGIAKNNYHYKKIQKQRYPERIKARAKVSRAIRSGKISRGKCIYCGTNWKVCAHITDYKRPLDSIIWACRPCNRKEHHGGKY